MTSRFRCLSAAVVALAVAGSPGCDQGEPANSGVTEPLLVHQAQFISGRLPGLAALDGGPATGPDGGELSPPPRTVTNVAFQNAIVTPGAAGKKFSGQATSDTVAVAIALDGLGSGYWVVPVQAADPMVKGQSDFSFSADFDANNPAGLRSLLTVGLDARGVAGRQNATPMCLSSRIPDNLHACDATRPVPPAVFTLQWDSNFDLDLHVITPDGVDVSPKNRATVPGDGGALPADVASIDRDSLGSCVPDGLRQEDLVFPATPRLGTYQIYADPFASCGQTAARFNVILSEVGSDGNLHTTFTRSGELLASQTTGGAVKGLFVLEKTFQ